MKTFAERMAQAHALRIGHPLRREVRVDEDGTQRIFQVCCGDQVGRIIITEQPVAK